ncbi:MAG: PQQ-dependent sugar dehydrogenase [Fimbriimonadaceae bacterium]
MRRLFTILFLGIATLSLAQSGFTDTNYVSGISIPTACAFAPDGRLFVCRQSGQIRVFKNGVLLATPFMTVACTSNSERGVLGITFDPNFNTNRFVYVFYTTSSASLNAPATPKNRVSRFVADGDTVMPGSETILVDLIPSDAGNHNAGCVRFGLDGKLYISTGDGGSTPSNAQNLNNLAGKILRINPDGSIPSDNPFFNQAPKRAEIWCYGLRNPFRFSFRPGTNVAYIGDVGQNTWEEVNIGLSGANYGWPNSEGPTTNPAYKTPLHSYNHNGGDASITGGVFVGSSQMPSSFGGRYIYGDYVLSTLGYVDVDSNNVKVGSGSFGNANGPVDFTMGPDGALYYVSINLGSVRRIAYTPVPATVNFVASIYGGEGIPGTVTISHVAPPAGTSVSLTSSKPQIVQVPSSVVVPANALQGNFSISSSGVDANTSAVISATANGVTKTKTLVVKRAKLVSLVLNPSTIQASQSGSGRVTVQGKAGPAGLSVSMFSAFPSIVQVPPAVTIPTGQSLANFTLTTSAVGATQQVSVNATLGSDSVAAVATVTNELLKGIYASKTSLFGGESMSGYASLFTPAQNASVVNLFSDTPLVTVPATVVIPVSASSSSFSITCGNVVVSTTATISGSLNGITKTRSFLIKPTTIISVVITPAPIRNGSPANGVVTLRQPAPAGGAVVSLSDNSSLIGTPASVTVPAGAVVGNFGITTTQVTVPVSRRVYATYGGYTTFGPVFLAP